jgi:hypothetical protein
MSSISNSPTARRRFCLALAAWPLAGWASAGPDSRVAGLRRWGSGEFRRFGFLVYEATLWAAGDDPLLPPLALRLTYRRNISGRRIADASVAEMRNLGAADAELLVKWGEQMGRLFPDVRPGDEILGVHLPDGARFYHNDRLLGAIDDPLFARAFFSIWLDPRSSAPELRSALLQRPAKRDD